MRESVDFIIPAHNEANTVADVVHACLAASHSLNGEGERSVTVVADHCEDATASVADMAGATVLQRSGDIPSKAAAVQVGVDSTDGSTIALFDADCFRLTGSHVLQLLRPVLDDRAELSVGVMDYGVLSGLARRYPWSTGQRVLRRDLFDWHDPRMTGYSIEMLMNERLGTIRGRTASVVLKGITQATKIQKHGWAEGTRRNLGMWTSIARAMQDMDPAALRAFFDSIVPENDAGRNGPRRSLLSSYLGYQAMSAAAAMLR